MTKRGIKKAFNKAELGMSEAIMLLMFDYQMSRGDAITYLTKV